jgi:hypothetical protein
MRRHQRLRQHASRLLALADNTRDEGRHELAAGIARLAADAYDQAFAMESMEQPLMTNPDVGLARGSAPKGNLRSRLPGER